MSDVHKNPPLSALNASYRADDNERRDDVTDTVSVVQSALRQAMTANGRRVQKPLSPAASQAKGN